MLITIKQISEEVKENGDPKHIEWEAVGADGKEIKVKLYPSIKQGDAWLHFEDRWDEFKNAKNKSYDIERANIKVEKGYWKPVIKATEAKDVFVKQAQEKLGEDRDQRIETQVAVKEIGEDWRTGKRDLKDPLVIARELWLMTHLNVEVINDKTKEKNTKTDNKETVWTKEEWSKNLNATKYNDWMKDWCGKVGIDWKGNLKDTLAAMNKLEWTALKAEVERRLK